MVEKKAVEYFPYPVEPAHPSIIRFREELLAILVHLRDEYQQRIDNTFDRVAEQIGFVVATTLPVSLEVVKDGKIKAVTLASEHLAGTVFQEGFAELFKSMAGDVVSGVSAGTYEISLLWHSALKLKLRTDWMEPAHFREILRRPDLWSESVIPGLDWVEPSHKVPGWRELQRLRSQAAQAEVVADVQPDPWRQKVLVSVLDEVYPDLHLVERLASYQRLLRRWQVGPGVMEPAHHRPWLEPAHWGPSGRPWQEPAHFRDLIRRLPDEALEELTAVLKRYGY
jgi:hypothetical protein